MLLNALTVDFTILLPAFLKLKSQSCIEKITKTARQYANNEYFVR